MYAIMSIKPQYSQAIMKGEKLFEFRKRPPKLAERVYIYESVTTRKIVGSFEFDIIEGSSEEVWEKCGYASSMNEEDYFLYFKNKSVAYAMRIKNLVEENIDPYALFENYTAPQNFKYYETEIISNNERKK